SRVVSGTFADWIDDFHWSGDGKSILFTGPVQGHNPIYRADLAGGAIAKLFDDQTIDAFEVAKNGNDFFYIHRSVGEAAEGYGGPQSQFGDAFRADWQVYPGAGYVVAFANPHGSTGRGQPYTAEISGDWGGAVFEDLMKVTDALEKLPYVDKNRMGAMGWSYGG